MLLLFLLNIVISAESEKCRRPEVDTPLGKVIGRSVTFHDIPVRTFQGVPFAKPPIDELRFKKPHPTAPWTQPYLADELPPSCVQYSKDPYPEKDDMPGQTPDCLYLNIWSPDTTELKNQKAVMFWIYGGAFKLGSSRLDFYDGTALAALGDVVVVTFNYRLAVEGFLYSGTDDDPGNMGLYDILEALKWVKSNIKYFGGDEDKITLFGQSTGAISIGMLMTSPLAKGLFSRAILQSGSPASLDAENNDKDFELSSNVAKAVGCAPYESSLKDDPEKVVRCLRGESALKLAKVEASISGDSLRGFYPRYGDDILPQNARQAFRKGNFEGVDVVIGVVRNEGAALISSSMEDVFGFFGQKNPKINKTFGEYIIRNNFAGFPDTDAVIKHYLGHLEEYDYDDVLYQVQTAAADYSRVCPSVYLAESIANQGSKVLFYYFTHRPSNSPWAPWMGVVHFDETPFVFGYPLRYPTNYTEKEQRLSRQMVQVWSDFAKNGPKPLMTFWPQYSEKYHLYFAFDGNGGKIGRGPHLENCEFFRPYFGF